MMTVGVPEIVVSTGVMVVGLPDLSTLTQGSMPLVGVGIAVGDGGDVDAADGAAVVGGEDEESDSWACRGMGIMAADVMSSSIISHAVAGRAKADDTMVRDIWALVCV